MPYQAAHATGGPRWSRPEGPAGNDRQTVTERLACAWPKIIAGIWIACGLACLAGCAHPCPNGECDWAHIYQREQIPLSLEFDAAEAVITPIIPPVPDPATVTDPERTPLYLSLQEAFAMALEQGNVGAQSINAAGQVSDDLV